MNATHSQRSKRLLDVLAVSGCAVSTDLTRLKGNREVFSRKVKKLVNDRCADTIAARGHARVVRLTTKGSKELCNSKEGELYKAYFEAYPFVKISSDAKVSRGVDTARLAISCSNAGVPFAPDEKPLLTSVGAGDAEGNCSAADTATAKPNISAKLQGAGIGGGADGEASSVAAGEAKRSLDGAMSEAVKPDASGNPTAKPSLPWTAGETSAKPSASAFMGYSYSDEERERSIPPTPIITAPLNEKSLVMYTSKELKRTFGGLSKFSVCSRAAGVILSPGGAYVVYSTDTPGLRIGPSQEVLGCAAIAGILKYNGYPIERSTEGFAAGGYNTQMLNGRMVNEDEAVRGAALRAGTYFNSAIVLSGNYDVARQMIRNAGSSKAVINAGMPMFRHIHFIPADGNGDTLLRIITQDNWHHKILTKSFATDAIASADPALWCDATIPAHEYKGTPVKTEHIYLLMDMDLSRLCFVLRRSAVFKSSGRDGNISIMCLDWQKEFLSEYAAPLGIRIRTIPQTAVEKLLGINEESRKKEVTADGEDNN